MGSIAILPWRSPIREAVDRLDAVLRRLRFVTDVRICYMCGHVYGHLPIHTAQPGPSHGLCGKACVARQLAY